MLTKRILYSFVLGFFFLNAFSQNPDYETLKVMGRVMDDGKTVENQAIIVFENNKRVDTLLSKSNGKFECILNLHRYYSLVFPGEDHKILTLVINTEIPEDFYYIPVYKCIIQMGDDYDDELAEKERYEDFPIGIVKYDNENLRFELDYQYFRSRIKEVK
jgi:hypothetical protein